MAVTQRPSSRLWQCSLRQGCESGIQPPNPRIWFPKTPLTISPLPSLRSSRLGPEGVLSLGQALDGCPHLEEIR